MTRPRKNIQKFGAHMSIAGGLYRAFEAAQAAGCDCLQVFVKNQRQWAGRPLTDEDIGAWREAARRTGIGPVVAHATYLANLGTSDRTMWNKSTAALTDELERCHMLNIPGLIFHPGAHLGAGLEKGMRQIVKGIDRVHQHTRGLSPKLLLETTAGQGTSIGHRFEHLAHVLEAAQEPERLGICIDTCHIFAAGYPLIGVDEYESTISELDRCVGLERVECIHVNDSKRGLGSRVDRHEHIGKGRIGWRGFRNLVCDERLSSIPKILETPKGVDQRGRDLDKVNLAKLRRLARGPAKPTARRRQ